MRTAVITGSASGLGAAIRRRFEAEGCRVIGVDLDDQEVAADLSTPSGRSYAMNEVLAVTGGRIDTVVVCAGLGPHSQPPARMVSVNYFGAVEVLDGLRPALAAGEDPAAVAIASNSIGIVPIDDLTLVEAMLHDGEARALALAERFAELDGAAIYAMTKVALTRAVRARVMPWGQAGVRLNVVAPGPVHTPMLQGELDDPVLGPLVDALPIPLDRRSEPNDIAAVVAFLASPGAASVHGAVLFADGGTDALVRADVV
jgi:NAD(P)-dependent dehydrogenase (short-subunit alcohol dehydrogenase family)